MRIHTDVITREDLLRAQAAAITAEDGYVFLHAMEHGSRSRSHAFAVGLEGDGTRNRRRRNPGTGANRNKGYAATWEAWGRFLAYLYRLDPDMTSTYYKSAEDFHTKTHGQFV